MKPTISRRQVLQGALATGAALHLPQVKAQSQAPLTLVVGFPAGDTTDTIARILAERLRDKLGRPIVVENVAGAASRLARARVKRAAPDGRTLIVSPVGGTSVLPHLFSAKNLGYVASDFVPVARLATYDYVLAAGPHVKATNMQELKAWLQANPSQATCANPGSGTIPHLLGIVLGEDLGTQMTQVAYKGTSPILPDLMAGNVSLMIGTPLNVASFNQAGKLRVLGIIGDKRSPLLPDVPTLKEQGVALNAESFHGIWAPAGTPDAIIAPINAAIVSVLNEPAVKNELMTKFALRAAPSSPAELAEAERQDTRLWAGFVKRSGIAITD